MSTSKCGESKKLAQWIILQIQQRYSVEWQQTISTFRRVVVENAKQLEQKGKACRKNPTKDTLLSVDGSLGGELTSH
jgi:hypothetical protein